jgi:hypothetical protein
MIIPIPGVCRYCSCSEENPCRVAPYTEGDTCGWLYGTDRTVCTASPCIRAYKRAETARARLAKPPRRLNSAEIHALICKRKRRAGQLPREARRARHGGQAC